MKASRLTLLLTLVLVLVVALTGSGSANYRDEVRIGISVEPTTLDPHVHSNVSTRYILQNIYRSLVSYQTNGELGYEIAESHTVSEDGLVYTFKIREGVTFHDGTPVTAEDVKYSIERILAPENGATFRSYFAEVGTVVNALDDYTVEFVLQEPCAPFMEYLSLPESAIISKKWMEAGNDITTSAMGAGPYKFVGWDRGLQIDLEAYEGYYKPGLPKTKNVSFIFYLDETTRNNALLTGEVDIIDYVNAASVIQFEKIGGVKVYSKQGPFMLLQFNCGEHSPFSDWRVRQAVAYAIDREAVIDTAFSGRGKPLYGFPTIAGQLGYHGELDDYFYRDIEKAKQLLAEAGYPEGFTCNILATSDYSFHEQTALVVQAALKEIGIEAIPELPDWATRIERSQTGDFDIIVSGTLGKIVDMDWASVFYKSGDVRMDFSPHFHDEEIDRLLEEGRRELDEAKRNEIYQRFRERALELSPIVYICWREQAFVTSEQVEDFDFLSGTLSNQAGMFLEHVLVKGR
jgi:glutathione transport system substrate-binding protein